MSRSKEMYREAMLPLNPGIDPVGVAALLEQFTGNMLDVAFWFADSCSPEELATMHRTDVLPVNIGPARFELSKANSVCELVLVRQMGLELSAAQQVFLKLVADDNGKNGKGKGGFLNKPPFSIPRMLRKAHRLYNERFPAEYTAGMREVVEQTIKVVHDFVEALSLDSSPAGELEERMFRDFPDLAEVTKSCNFAPLTVGRYLRDMVKVDSYSSERIFDSVYFWINLQHEINGRIEEAREEYRSLGPEREFFADHGRFRGLCLEPHDHKFMLDAVWMAGIYKIVVNRDESGHMAIMSSRLDMAMVASALMALEPGRWVYVEGQSLILNKHCPPTDLPLATILRILQETKIREKEIKNPVGPAGSNRRRIFNDRRF